MSHLIVPGHHCGAPDPSGRRRRLPGFAWVVVAGIATLVAAGCGATPGSTSTPAGNAGTVASGASGANAPAGGEAANGEANTGEAPSVPFESPKYRYRVDAPGAMTEGADGTATAHFGAERLSIRVVTGAAAADPMAVAKADMDQARSTPNFSSKSAPAATKLKASNATVKAVYSATDGTNPVTGKPNNVVVVKYWVPKDPSTLAVLTYTVTDTQYDPQGADDVANTFRWL